MRKKILAHDVDALSPKAQPWLDLERLAQVEVTSENPAYPVEAALLLGESSGWRASQSGEQRLRLIFDQPQTLKRIYLVFDEQAWERTQELVLRWSPQGNSPSQEIVRQQFNFSPPGTVREVEDYTVNLSGVGALELQIKPHVGGGEAIASLMQLRLA